MTSKITSPSAPTTTNGGKAMLPEDEGLKRLWDSMGPVEGVYLPPQRPGAPEWSEKIRQLRNMKLRDDDVFLFTYPKAGTHWLWEVMCMLRRGEAEHEKHSKVQMMMEFVDVPVFDDMPSPRIFNTHLPLSFIPLPELIQRKLRTVHVYRNPKSTCVSLYHMAISAPEKIPVPMKTFDDFFQYYFFSDNKMLGDYFDYLRQMHNFQQQHPECPTLNIAYEDVKKDPVKIIKQLSKFMGIDASDSLCRDIAEACSFESMKRQASEKALAKLGNSEESNGDFPIMYHPQATIYRAGQIADWKNYFTAAQSEKVDELVAKETKGLPFTLTFE